MSGETFMELLAPNLRALRRLLKGRLRTPGQADDVLQEALLHAGTSCVFALSSRAGSGRSKLNWRRPKKMCGG